MVGTYQIDDRWFLETSVVPGIFLESVSRNNLGSKFEIRSLLGIGYLLNSGNRLSIALTHKSNAGTASRNPGVNSVLIRLHREF
jgi:lipid A 3-O-deacylase